MLLIFQVITAIPLLIIVVSDFRKYTISSVWLGIFAVSNIAVSFIESGVKSAGTNLLINTILLLLLYVLLWGYVKFFRASRYKSLRDTIGLGDFLFLPAITPLFGPVDFTLFLTVSFILSLVWWSILRIAVNKDKAIPLVGTVGCCYLFYHISMISI